MLCGVRRPAIACKEISGGSGPSSPSSSILPFVLLPQGARRAARGSLTAELNGRGEQDEASSKGHSFVELTKAKEEIQVID